MIVDKAILLQGLGRILPQGLGFVLGIVVVRIAGLDVMGKYAEFMAVLTMSFGVLAAGINTNYLRSGSIHLFRNSIWGIWLVAVLVGIVVVPIYAWFTNQFVECFSILFFLVGLTMMRSTDIYIVKLRFLNKDKFAILPRVIPYIIIIGLFLVFRPSDIFIFGFMFAIGWLSTIFFLLKSQSITKRLPITVDGVQKVFFSSIIIAGTTLATQVYANVDQLMIANYLGANASGGYKIAISISSLVMPLIGVFSFIYLSQLQRLIRQSALATIKKNFRNQVYINGALGLGFFFISVLMLDYVIPILYGEISKEAILGAIILSAGVSINVISMVFSYSLLAIHKEDAIFWTTIVGALLNILLNYLLIPSFGIPGAALASVGTQLLILIVLWYLFSVRVNFFKVVQLSK